MKLRKYINLIFIGIYMAEVSSKELYEFKKVLKELAEKKGRVTELVSVYIPPDK